MECSFSTNCVSILLECSKIYTEILEQKKTGKDEMPISKSISDESGDKNHDLLSYFLKHDPNLNKEELRDIALNFIVCNLIIYNLCESIEIYLYSNNYLIWLNFIQIAGRDTTRMLLSWCLYELSMDKIKM